MSTAAAIVRAAASYSASMVFIGSRAHKRVGALWFAGLVARVVNGTR